MAIVSTGYAGTVNDVQWAQMSRFFGQDFGVLNPNDLAVTQQSGAKTFNVAAGTFYGRGIMDISDSTVNVAPTVPVSGGQWFLIVARRIWATKVTSFLAVAGPTTSATPPTSKPANYPTLQRNPGVQDDQPLAWVWVNASNTTTVIFDQRIFSDGRVANFNAIPPVGFLTRGSQLTVEPVRMIVVDNGTAWLPVTMRVSGTTAQRTEATNAGMVAEGMEWRDTTDNSDYVRLSGAWHEAQQVIDVAASGGSLGSNWTPGTGGETPRILREGRRRTLFGTARHNTGANFAAILTLGPVDAPAEDMGIGTILYSNPASNTAQVVAMGLVDGVLRNTWQDGSLAASGIFRLAGLTWYVD